MQWHLPLVSSNEGGIPDVIQDGINGFVCKRKDVNTLADALEKLLNDKALREKMGNKGHEIYQALFTLKVFENRMKNIFRSLIIDRHS